MMAARQSSLSITFTVWKALFLREAVTRLSARRGAWLWILVEPMAYMAFLMTIFGFVFHRIISGVDGTMFIATGLLGFFLARNTASQCMGAIGANAALFTYRQVLPIDTVLVRILLEGFVMVLSSILLLAAAGLFGLQVIPHDPLLVIATIAGLWLNGAGLGLMLSLAGELSHTFEVIGRLLFRPLYFISGVMIPAMTHPQPYRGWLFFNPFLHGLELLRGAYFAQYHIAPEASYFYLYSFALVTVFFGLALHVRYADRVVAK
jgi:capsular polysaccharide transport system permease protein